MTRPTISRSRPATWTERRATCRPKPPQRRRDANRSLLPHPDRHLGRPEDPPRFKHPPSPSAGSTPASIAGSRPRSETATRWAASWATRCSAAPVGIDQAIPPGCRHQLVACGDRDERPELRRWRVARCLSCPLRRHETCRLTYRSRTRTATGCPSERREAAAARPALWSMEPSESSPPRRRLHFRTSRRRRLRTCRARPSSNALPIGIARDPSRSRSPAVTPSPATASPARSPAGCCSGGSTSSAGSSCASTPTRSAPSMGAAFGFRCELGPSPGKCASWARTATST